MQILLGTSVVDINSFITSFPCPHKLIELIIFLHNTANGNILQGISMDIRWGWFSYEFTGKYIKLVNLWAVW